MFEKQEENPLSKAMKAVDGLELADTKVLLVTRGNTHGSFAKNASISQQLKAIFNADDLTDVQREALDQIALKLSRILSGKADFDDHWDDIAGYAKLVSDDNLARRLIQESTNEQ